MVVEAPLPADFSFLCAVPILVSLGAKLHYYLSFVSRECRALPFPWEAFGMFAQRLKGTLGCERLPIGGSVEEKWTFIYFSKEKIKVGDILGVRNPACVSPLVLTSCRTDTVPGLWQWYRPIKQLVSHVTPEEQGKDWVLGGPLPRRVFIWCDLWWLWVPLVCLVNTFSSFQRAQMAPLGGPSSPQGHLLCLLCSRHSVKKKKLSNNTNHTLSCYLFTHLNSVWFTWWCPWIC